METETHKVDYNNLKSFWNEIPSLQNYGINYLMDHEGIAFYRFKKDARFILDNMPETKSAFLDLGCGNGNLIDVVSDNFQHSDGIDLSEKFIVIARDRFKDRPNISLKNENVTNSQIAKKYDMINISELLMYLNDEDVVGLLVKVREGLNDKGVVTVRESISTRKTVILNRGKHETIRRTMNDFGRLFKSAGLAIKKVRQDYDYNYAWMTCLYFKFIPKLLNNQRFINFFLNNFITRFVFLYIPLKLMMILRKNAFVHYYFLYTK